MKKLGFTKMVASGNDFVIIDNRHAPCAARFALLAKKLCDRIYGIGADGLLLLEKAKGADIRMRIFNADGTEAEMCGNGARCAALWANEKLKNKKLTIKTKAGIIAAEVSGDNVKIKLTDPKNIKTDISIKVNNRALKVNFINTGVPHAVIFVEGLNKINVAGIGREIRHHNEFKPAGTNVDFVQILNNDTIKTRTYERGVEDETLACGTGAAAAALITNYQLPITNYGKINVYTQGGEILKVYFERVDNGFRNVWLEGKAQVVFKGDYYV